MGAAALVSKRGGVSRPIVRACVLERPVMDQHWEVELTEWNGKPLKGNSQDGLILCRPSPADAEAQRGRVILMIGRVCPRIARDSCLRTHW